MRSTLIREDEFFTKMKKKPALQQILDTIEEYSVEQLETIPGQPLWIRKQLVKIRTGEDFDSKKAAAALAAQQMITSAPTLFPDQLELRVWNGMQGWLTTQRSVQLEIHEGDLFLVLQEGLALWGHSAVKPTWSEFISRTTPLRFVTKAEYLDIYMNHLATKHGMPTQILGDNTASSSLSALGVRIER